MDYDSLKNAVTKWTHRADLVSLADDFIDLAEAKLSRDLLVSRQEIRATTVAGTEYLSMPDDCVAIRGIRIDGRSLDYVTPADMAHGGTPARYTIVGDEIRLDATSNGVVEIAYYGAIPPLSDAAPSNWLIAAFPDAYLYAVLAEAWKYASDDAQVQKYDALYRDVVGSIKAEDRKRKYGPSLTVSPSRSAMIV